MAWTGFAAAIRSRGATQVRVKGRQCLVADRAECCTELAFANIAEDSKNKNSCARGNEVMKGSGSKWKPDGSWLAWARSAA